MPQESYFTRTDEHTFESHIHTQGAWNTAEQHVAPSFGLLVHEIERDRDARRDDALMVTRASFDIYGTFTIDPVSVSTRVLRPGLTVELVEASLEQNGRAAIVVRAWLMKGFDTTDLAANELAPMPSRDDMEESTFALDWPGGAVRSIETRKQEEHPGRACSWTRPKVALVSGEEPSALARMTGLFDFANGLTPRARPEDVLFPNLDLTVHYLREPVGEWLGYDTTVTYSAVGTGLTHTVLHDDDGPFAVQSQGLTVRPGRG
ncbi:MAG: thioesterase family protein [Agrococcus casei]|uniref:thioesterase family protein n=1 Tax=Agrococcus casei TaxID=343512 RepID=UPI003F9267C7